MSCRWRVNALGTAAGKHLRHAAPGREDVHVSVTASTSAALARFCISAPSRLISHRLSTLNAKTWPGGERGMIMMIEYGTRAMMSTSVRRMCALSAGWIFRSWKGVGSGY